MINNIRVFALENDIPIIEDEIKEFLINYINKNSVVNILEIGSAIGYSAIVMASSNDKINVTTIERDESRYKKAIENIDNVGLSSRISIFNADALEFDTTILDKKYDLIFIDAAKAQSRKFFEKYEKLLSEDGVIIIDNINFHGFANGHRDSKNRNTRQLVRKINDFKDWLSQNKNYLSEYQDIGDGILLAKRKD